MVDFKFNWQEELDVGFSIVNEQHKELFRIGRNLEQLILTHCIGVTEKQLLEVIVDLRDYVSYHFYYEEQLMRKANYAEYDHHKREHNRFLQKINAIDIPQLAKNPYEGLNQIRDNLVDYIFYHLMNEDMNMIKAIPEEILEDE